MTNLSASEFIGATVCIAIMLMAFFGTLRCSQNSDTINKIIKNQCGQIDSRKDYDKCVESLLK